MFRCRGWGLTCSRQQDGAHARSLICIVHETRNVYICFLREVLFCFLLQNAVGCRANPIICWVYPTRLEEIRASQRLLPRKVCHTVGTVLRSRHCLNTCCMQCWWSSAVCPKLWAMCNSLESFLSVHSNQCKRPKRVFLKIKPLLVVILGVKKKYKSLSAPTPHHAPVRHNYFVL